MKRGKSKEIYCLCPYCDEEFVAQGLPFCQRCQVQLKYCARCQIAVERKLDRCPRCGGELEWR